MAHKDKSGKKYKSSEFWQQKQRRELKEANIKGKFKVKCPKCEREFVYPYDVKRKFCNPCKALTDFD